MSKKIFRPTEIELPDGTIQSLKPLPRDVTFQSVKAKANPNFRLGFGGPIVAPPMEGVKTKYAFTGTDGEFYEAEYVHPNFVKRDNKTGDDINLTKIQLRNGFMNVPANQPGLYMFLKEHYQNGSNPHRDTGLEERFTEIIPAPSAEEVAEIDRKVTIAKAKIYQMNDYDLAAFAQTVGMDTSVAIFKMRQTLMEMVKTNPDMEIPDVSNTSQPVSTAAKVNKAIAERKITYSGRESSFYWSKSRYDDENPKILKTTGKDLKALVALFDEDEDAMALLDQRL